MEEGWKGKGKRRMRKHEWKKGMRMKKEAEGTGRDQGVRKE